MAVPLPALVRRTLLGLMALASGSLLMPSDLAAREVTVVRGGSTMVASRASPPPQRNPAVTGRDAILVIDALSGRELDGSNADDLRHPASLTKMMTLYLLFQALDSGRLKLDDALPVSSRAVAVQPTKLGLLAGGTLGVREAALGLIVKSANDAAVVVAEALGGDEAAFAEIMTRTAHKLGMSRTVFRNASGLPHPAQVTTARDMAILGRALLLEFPHYYGLFATRSWSFRGRELNNHNRLLATYAGADGIKTGYIISSGFNLVTSARRGDQRLVAVVLGGDSAGGRDAIMAAVLDTGFAEATRQQLAPWRAPTPPASARYRADQFFQPTTYATARPLQVPAGSTAAARTLSTASHWAMQLGSYGTAAAARNALQQALARVPELQRTTQSSVERLSSGNRTLFRARLITSDEESAQRGCRRLEARKLACSAVEAQGGSTAQLR